MIMIILISMMVCAARNASAQQNTDPTYSIHNYKHPNKAAEAEKQNYDRASRFKYNHEKNTAHRNYKAQNARVKSEGGIIPPLPIESHTNTMFSKRNYKRQF